MKAHEFSLPDQQGEMQKLQYYRGKWVVLYFYPKDDTPGCTKEACSFRDSIYEFDKRGVVIIGMSKDSVASHKTFSEKYHLNFMLLADESAETIKAYGAWSDVHIPGISQVQRKTVLIDPKGEIVKEYPRVNPLGHSEQLLKDLDAFLA